VALIDCPECDTQVSSAAVSCPKCGCPIAESVRGAVGKTDKPKPKKAPMSTGLKVRLGFLFTVFGLFVILILYWSGIDVDPDSLSHDELRHKATTVCYGESVADDANDAHEYCPERAAAVYRCRIEFGDCLQQRECKAVHAVWSQCTYCGVWKDTGGSDKYQKPKCEPFLDELVLREAPMPATNVAHLTDDELCASYCKAEFPNGRCVFGILPTPYDECLKGCKGLITVDTCAEFERPLLACQVRKNDCGGCPTEFRAVNDCMDHCAELQIRGETLPEHCSNRRPE
jgi:hypothetical protein